ncbi:hypothetical protein VNI00_003828 [Paramarasmius palmivorus]|uniref:Uncharacterized protein n=1 Tax=Paramarasmius palmivorus TaxID=297713 RepID=A0AAW0DN73_9AGAR
MKVHEAATWPDYLCSKMGLSPLYAFAIFLVHSPPVSESYIQVMGDAHCFIEGANDVLSFYKEFLAGETGNYISCRVVVMKRSQVEALQDVANANRVVNAYHRICETLKGQELMAWMVFAAGYLTFPCDRYLLDEILSPVLYGGEMKVGS